MSESPYSAAAAAYRRRRAREGIPAERREWELRLRERLRLQAQLNRRVEKVAGYAPLSELGHEQWCEFHEAVLDAGTFEELPGKWQAAILEAEANRP